MASNQTATFLRKRFEEAGVRLQHRHGQNFLIDLNLMRLLAETAKLGPDDVVLEVGTGTGALSAIMAPQAAAIVTVEIDPQLHQLASEELFDFPNVTLLQQDALKSKNTFDPRVLETLQARLAAAPGRVLKLAANLPYSVATPVISNLLAWSPVPRSMTVTIQKELADRMVAAPGTKDYGALSIWLQSQCEVRIVRLLPPTVFWPRPKVTSAIVHIETIGDRVAAIGDRAFFQQFVRSLFLHRRKFIRSVLQVACRDLLSKSQVDEVIAEQGFGPDTRAEQLSPDAMLALCQAVQRRDTV